MKLSKMIFAFILLTILSCNKDNEDITIQPGNDPNFTIVSHNDDGFSNFPKKTEVFGIPIYAVAKVEDAKLLHAANVMAQYLDNNEDGTMDNQAVLDAMISNQAFMVMWKSENDLDDIDEPSGIGQDLGNDETHPSFVANGKTGSFDATLEEVFHIITNAGFSQVYPDVFGTNIGTSLSDAMDVARGGQFTSIPNPYPSNAWYTYDDTTCDYECMATEYFYWAMTSILGGQENRLNEIDNEWRLNTKEKVEQTDNTVYQLLTDPTYKFPTVLPDGTYKR